MTKLKPCPFCGGNEIEVQHYVEGPSTYNFTIECMNKECLLQPETMFEPTLDSAIKAWNYRPNEGNNDY